MKTTESELAKPPMEEEANNVPGNCEGNPATDIPQQSWQLAITQDQADSQGNPQQTLVAYPNSQTQRQAVQPISLDPRLKQSLGKQQSFSQAADIWHTTSLPGAAQVIPQMPTFINYNNNASTGVSLAPSGIDCAHVQRPSVGLIQQVVECFKRSTKKEMLPSQVYVEMEMVFPYYKHIIGQKRKSWKSSIRHALTTPRFTSRKISQEDKSTTKRGCLWSLNADFDENAPVTKTPRRRRTPNPLKATRRKQRFIGNTRTDYMPPLYHVNRNNPTFYQPQQHVAQRYPFVEMPDTTPMQSTFSPGPTGPIQVGGGNMYYQPYRAPTVGYVIAGQKMAMPQQAMQPVNMGQWNVSGFSACNQQQYLPNNAAFFGGNSAMIHNNQNNQPVMNQAFCPTVMPTMLQTNQNNNIAVIQGQQQPTPSQPTPISIQMAEQGQAQDVTMCDAIQTNEDITEQSQDFPNNQSESQVHDEIKEELQSLVYESLDICNSEDQGQIKTVR
ncbi:uncharacterized protein LOC100889230 [Strongylocentrotus purpuratus]|uniref:Fork-head domain-containing protein n=1 Tax=Strongylocentrotus purpuratus TaxID=7668 RepID=A0A7M7NFA3_STRPU|nr:uncharacterized protein LOC100889230 [Strongylocentrotus purpuratus]XP_030835815.1 uncharacterized protein LOC100889230 [Strongylocentrotus purpuratus]